MPQGARALDMPSTGKSKYCQGYQQWLVALEWSALTAVALAPRSKNCCPDNKHLEPPSGKGGSPLNRMPLFPSLL
jgi:hypothetical protein